MPSNSEILPPAPITVTVIIPTYKRLPYLKAALQSVANQTFTHYEVIVINDYPEDGQACLELVETFAFRHSKVLSNETSIGGNASRNRGIRLAKGHVIAFLDDDDEWMPTKLEKHVDVHARTGEPCLVYSGCRIEWEDGLRPPFLAYAADVPANVTRAMARGNFCPKTTSAVTVTAEIFNLAGMFDEQLTSFQDWDMWYRLSKMAQFVRIVEPLCVFRQHYGERTSQDVKKRMGGLRLVVAKWKDELDHEAFWRVHHTRTMLQAASKALHFRRSNEAREYLSQIDAASLPVRDRMQWYALSTFAITGAGGMFEAIRRIRGYLMRSILAASRG